MNSSDFDFRGKNAETPKRPEISPYAQHLRELAGRLHSLTFREMNRFADAVRDAATHKPMIEAILDAADALASVTE